jgi:hypothetical protein
MLPGREMNHVLTRAGAGFHLAFEVLKVGSDAEGPGAELPMGSDFDVELIARPRPDEGDQLVVVSEFGAGAAPSGSVIAASPEREDRARLGLDVPAQHVDEHPDTEDGAAIPAM